jgi:hypothetical protein
MLWDDKLARPLSEVDLKDPVIDCSVHHNFFVAATISKV